jgi:BED zinc finger
MSIAWKHCTRVNDEQASCKLCGETLWCKGGSTSTLIKHIQKRHPIEPEISTSRTSNACTFSSLSSLASSAATSTSKITWFFNRAILPMNRDREEQFKQKVVDMIIQDLRPLTIVTSKGLFMILLLWGTSPSHS